MTELTAKKHVSAFIERYRVGKEDLIQSLADSMRSNAAVKQVPNGLVPSAQSTFSDLGQTRNASTRYFEGNNDDERSVESAAKASFESYF